MRVEFAILVLGGFISFLFCSSSDFIQNPPAELLVSEWQIPPKIKLENKAFQLIDIYPKMDYKIALNGGDFNDFTELNSQLKWAKGIEEIPTSFIWKRPFIDKRKACLVQAYSTDKKKRSRRSGKLIFKEEPHLPIVSIAVAEKDFFSFYKGIYVQGEKWQSGGYLSLRSNWWDYPANYSERGKKSQRTAYVQFIENGKESETQKMGVKIHGNATRAFPQKSLKLVAHRYYGEDRIKSHFLSSDLTYNELILRNSGNDWGHSMFADAYMQQASKNLHLYLQSAKACVLYINGVYWGIHNLREKQNDYWAKQIFNCKKKEVLIFDSPGERSDGNKDLLKLARKWIKQICSPHKIQEAFEMLEENEIFDYLICQIFWGNTDWGANNQRYALVKDKGKVKVHPLVYDLDFGMGYSQPKTGVKVNLFQMLRNNSSETGHIYRYILQTPHLKNAFKARFKQCLDEEFTPEKLTLLLKQFKNTYQKEMPEHLKRWRKPATMNDWEESIRNFEYFVKNRSTVVNQQLKKI